MANKRDLKKDIQLIFSELLTECYTLTYLFPQIDAKKADALAVSIIEKSNDFAKRAGNADGKENPQIVKAYYKKLYNDIENAVATIVEEISTLKTSK
ncbi:MAG: hypothetical protein KA397_04250 [Paludibacteraceae bacterium]|nr:hypothetical protein [Paludibacteraceae bacterium]MBP6284709.1 hypothetical protein [Paludibacteraceae bacterium]